MGKEPRLYAQKQILLYIFALLLDNPFPIKEQLRQLEKYPKGKANTIQINQLNTGRAAPHNLKPRLTTKPINIPTQKNTKPEAIFFQENSCRKRNLS